MRWTAELWADSGSLERGVARTNCSLLNFHLNFLTERVSRPCPLIHDFLTLTFPVCLAQSETLSMGGSNQSGYYSFVSAYDGPSTVIGPLYGFTCITLFNPHNRCGKH